MHKYVLLLALALTQHVMGQLLSPENIHKNGSLKFGDVEIYTVHFGEGWSYASQKNNLVYPLTKDSYKKNTWEKETKFKTARGDLFDFVQRGKSLDNNSFSIYQSFKNNQGVATNKLAMVISLPVATYAGETVRIGESEVILPEKPGKAQIGYFQANNLIFPFNKKSMSANFQYKVGISVQDNRAYKGDSFNIMLNFPVKDKVVKDSGLKVVFREEQGGVPVVVLEDDMEVVSGITVAPDGSLKIADISGHTVHFGPGWAYSKQAKAIAPEAGFPFYKKGKWQLKGEFSLAKGRNFSIQQTLTKTGGNGFALAQVLDNSAGVETNQLAYSFRLPVNKYIGRKIKIDGKELSFPDEYKKSGLGYFTASKLEIPLDDRILTVTGKIKMTVQDDRAFKIETFSLRMMFSQDTGLIKSSSVNLNFNISEIESVPIRLGDAATTYFADDVANDKKGGWTDQGSVNDLSVFKPGPRKFCGVNFDILADKDGKSCIVLAGKYRDYFPDSATLKMSGQSFNYLYLLHTLAWVSGSDKAIGDILLTYDDGSTETITAELKKEAADWWGPFPLKNGFVAWTGNNNSGSVGLFLSKFKTSGKPVKSITFKSAKNSVWMIAGLSSSKSSIYIDNTIPFIVRENDSWKPYEGNQSIEKGSVLDFSNLLDAPAGKYGQVISKNGEFVFADKPDKSIRFYGNNLCFSANYLDKEMAEKLADQLSRIGYNAMRFHHFDRDLVERSKDNGTYLNKEKLDKIDYLFHCFKQRGIYVSIDVHCSRSLNRGAIEGFSGKFDGHTMKYLIPVLDSAFENWKAYAKNLLTHKNKYTGLSWAEDPALFGICVVNEGVLVGGWHKDPAVKRIYEKRFDEWVQKENLVITAANKDDYMYRFLTELQIKSFAMMKSYLRSLGVKAQLTDANFRNDISLAPLRSQLDYVDNHEYWDHPMFPENPWNLPMAYRNRSAVSGVVGTPRKIMPSRIMGKPYTITEFNYVYPNEYRAEGGVLMGAYAGFQNWNGLFRFAYSHHNGNLYKKSSVKGFDLVCDPVNSASERLAILLFLRGDVKAGMQAYSLQLPEDLTKVDVYKKLPSSYSQDFMKLGLTHRIGTSVGKVPAGVTACDPDNIPKVSAEKFVSDTEEITLDQKAGTLAVKTANTEAFVLNKNSNKIRGDVSAVETDGEFAVVGITSVDGKSLVDSQRMLIMHITDALATGATFDSEKRFLLKKFGHMPNLIKKGTAKITVKTSMAQPVLYMVASSGERLQKIPFERNGGNISFTASTVVDGKATGFYYELVNEK